MSASEKLKALDSQIGGFGPYPISVFDDDIPLHAVRNVLPQIVAVVEAAEKQGARFGALHRALAALDEALS